MKPNGAKCLHVLCKQEVAVKNFIDRIRLTVVLHIKYQFCFVSCSSVFVSSLQIYIP